MCFVALGFLNCDSKLGSDPLTNGENAIQAGSSGYMTLCFCFGPLIAAWVNAFIWMGKPEIFWPLFIVGCLMILIWVFRFGRSYVVIDTTNQHLIKSVSGCCCMAYRRNIIGPLSDVEKFFTVTSNTTKINNEPAMDLFVGLKNEKRFKIINTEQRSDVINKAGKIQEWWNNNDAASDYNVRFEIGGNILSQISTYHASMANNQELVQTGSKYESEFREFVVKIKLRNTQKGKIIDMACEFEKDKMLSEYKILKNMKGSSEITDEKLTELLLDKADTILKARNVTIDVDQMSGQNEGDLPAYQKTYQ